jgi:hypothetical protein
MWPLWLQRQNILLNALKEKERETCLRVSAKTTATKLLNNTQANTPRFNLIVWFLALI